MIKLYTDTRVIVSKKEIITSVTDIERTLITLKENTKKDMDRRQFMIFSAVLSGSMVFPTKAEAWIWWLIRPVLTFSFRRRATTTFVSNAVRLGNGYKNASKINKVKKLEKVENTFKAKLGLNLNPQALLSASDVVASKQTEIIWDREGYHQSPKTGKKFQNIAWLEIQNKTNQSIETKIKLALLSGQDEQTFKNRFFLKVAPNANQQVDISYLYRNIPKRSNGIQYIIYELETHQNQLRIRSPNKKIYVTNLIT